jgi:NTE family protein
MEHQQINGVFEGGGVKGIGLVGAVAVTEAQGYRFDHVAGTSAGAIVAAFVAAGYSSQEMREILKSVDYREFKDRGPEDYIPFIGPMVSIGTQNGLYEGDYFEEWLRELLTRKDIRTFRDLIIEQYRDSPRYRWKLQVVASDVTRGQMIVLPNDIRQYGLQPEDLDVARAVRMSMSLPFFFEPVVLRDVRQQAHYIVDGGLLSNYPVWLFDDTADSPTMPTVGFKLIDPQEGKPRAIHGPISLFSALFATMMEAHDARYIATSNFRRTIPIPTVGVQTTQFDITPEQQEALYESGVAAAEKFYGSWEYGDYDGVPVKVPEVTA